MLARETLQAVSTGEFLTTTGFLPRSHPMWAAVAKWKKETAEAAGFPVITAGPTSAVPPPLPVTHPDTRQAS